MAADRIRAVLSGAELFPPAQGPARHPHTASPASSYRTPPGPPVLRLLPGLTAFMPGRLGRRQRPPAPMPSGCAERCTDLEPARRVAVS